MAKSHRKSDTVTYHKEVVLWHVGWLSGMCPSSSSKTIGMKMGLLKGSRRGDESKNHVLIPWNLQCGAGDMRCTTPTRQ